MDVNILCHYGNFRVRVIIVKIIITLTPIISIIIISIITHGNINM